MKRAILSTSLILVLGVAVAGCGGSSATDSSSDPAQSGNLLSLNSCGNGICEPNLGEDATNCIKFGIPIGDGDCFKCGPGTPMYGCCHDDECLQMEGKSCNSDGCCDPATEDLGCSDCHHDNVGSLDGVGTFMMPGCTAPSEPINLKVKDSTLYAVNNRFVAYGYVLDWLSIQTPDIFGIIEPKESLFSSSDDQEILAFENAYWRNIKVVTMKAVDVGRWFDTPLSYADRVGQTNVWVLAKNVLDMGLPVKGNYTIKIGYHCSLSDWPSLLAMVVDLAEVGDNPAGKGSLDVMAGVIDFIRDNADDYKLMNCLADSIPMDLWPALNENIYQISQLAKKVMPIYKAYVLFGVLVPYDYDLWLSRNEDNRLYCVSDRGIRKDHCPLDINNFCELNGYWLGSYCDGDEIIICGTGKDGYYVETDRVECPLGCIEGEGCAGCESNFCSTNGYDSGTYCDGDEEVSCGNDGLCTIETSRKICNGGCLEAESICYEDCEPGSGFCCDAEGDFRDETYECDNWDVEYGCPDGTACGDDVKRQFGKRYCSGESAECDGELIPTNPTWYNQDACTMLEMCVPGNPQCQPCVECECEASEGSCCDGCSYKGESEPCDEEIQYFCDGNECGDNLMKMTRAKSCAGGSSICEGDYGGWATTTAENCDSDELCSASQEDCVYEGEPGNECYEAECTSGDCCNTSIQQYHPSGYDCDTETDMRCSSTSCGGDVQEGERVRECTGSSASCPSTWSAWDWDTIDGGNCTIEEKCSTIDYECHDNAQCCASISWSANLTALDLGWAVRLDWDPAPGATKYMITRAPGNMSCPPTSWELEEVDPDDDTYYDIPGSGCYTYGIFARNTCLDYGGCGGVDVGCMP